MTVDFDGVPSEGTGACCVGCTVPSQVRLTPLTQPVHVQDAHKVVQLVVACLVESLPDRSFRHLAVSEYHPYAIRELVEVFASECDTDPNRQSLAQ